MTFGVVPMEPVWLKNYQPGVPKTINPDAYGSLNEIFEEAFEKYSTLPAYTNMGQTLTYAELDKQSKHFASFLRNELLLPKGSRVAIVMPNIIQYPVAMVGILRAGCTVVNVNPLYTVDEFDHQLKDAQPSVLIVLENFASVIAQVVKDIHIQHVIIAKISDVFPKSSSWLVEIYVKYIKRMVPKWHLEGFFWYKDVLRIGAKSIYHKVPMISSDIAFLQYTGGTTGGPKGAMLTHRNMVANVLQASSWMNKTLVPRKEIIITALPLYHIFSLTANCLTFIYYGALNVLITNPRDTKTFIKELKKHKFTAITGVNTLFNLLLNTPEFASVDFSALRLALGGGMAVQRVVATRWQALTKRPLLEAYGLTETSPAACINPMDLTGFNGTVGLPVSSTEITVRDDNGVEVGFNHPGELWIRGPQVMKGYWQKEQDTLNVLTQDGWLKTGDIVTVNEQGFVAIVDRKKDMILVSGFNVYPNEVEDVIASMPGIKEVGVVGVPDKITGEIVKAFVVATDPMITQESVKAYCHQHLTGYKIPKVVEFRDSLPKTNVGKILRRALK